MTLFNEVAIRKMIDFKWVLAKKYTIRKLLMPYLAFMFVYLSYMNYFYLIRFNKGWYQYIDMTGPHTYSNEDSEKFFEALANC